MTEEGNVFSRWSRRKRKVAQEAETTPDVPETAEEVVAEPETKEEEAALLEELGLPVPEDLGEGDDFSPFMKAGVPEFLRKRALRVLWRSNPVLANLDGLNDYDEDFNAPELTQKVLATGYQVGRGFLKKIAEAAEDDAPPTPETEPDQPEETTVVESEAIDLEVAPEETAFSEPGGEPIRRPRRMRFET